MNKLNFMGIGPRVGIFVSFFILKVRYRLKPRKSACNLHVFFDLISRDFFLNFHRYPNIPVHP